MKQPDLNNKLKPSKTEDTDNTKLSKPPSKIVVPTKLPKQQKKTLPKDKEDSEDGEKKKGGVLSSIGRMAMKPIKKVKNVISNSIVGKAWNKYQKAGKKVSRAMKKVWRGIKKVGRTVKKGVKKVYRGAKKVTKVFAKASHAVGKFVMKSLFHAAIAPFKVTMSLNPAEPVFKLLDMNGAWTMTKLGWKMIKYMGKVVWKGLKFLLSKLGGVFKRILGVPKFKNAIEWY